MRIYQRLYALYVQREETRLLTGTLYFGLDQIIYLDV
jgi:hypothetical protein